MASSRVRRVPAILPTVSAFCNRNLETVGASRIAPVTAKKGLAALEKALGAPDAAEALANCRELVPDEGKGPQQVVVYAYACVLEVTSAGLSILFDRFDDDELAKCESAIEAIGATGALADFRTLQTMFRTAIADGKDRFAASEWLTEQSEARAIDRNHDRHANELERRLLDFCRSHADDIAAGGLDV